MALADRRGSAGPARLTRLGFADPARAARLLGPGALGLWLGDGGGPADEDAAVVVAALSRAADPDLSLLGLARLGEALDPAGRRDLLDELRRHGGLRERLLGVLGSSAALGDHLAAHPGDWALLADDEAAATRPSALGLQRTLLESVGAPVDEPPPWGSGGARARGAGPAVAESLRTAYRRSLLGLAGRDLAGGLALEDVAGELADLATATLSAALALAVAGLPVEAPAARLAVVAMGKCGGRELNYVSDVDVIFVAEPGEPGGPEQPDPSTVDSAAASTVDDEAALRTATALAMHLTRVCAAAAFPVDAALRPEGKAGPLVRTLASHAAYYQRWARTWEFQALLKARPAAGDLALGRRFVDTVAPLVWTAADRDGFVEDVQEMRRRVERTLPPGQAERELKLGPGGLRDVEFAVQLLQLVHGRADETLHSGTTLVALEALAQGGYVGRDDAATLAASYRFLRTVEHRLQLQRLRRTHLLPDDPVGLRWLARSLGYRPDARGDAVAVFESERTLHTREVRRLHEKLFYRPLLNAVARVPTGELQLTPDAARARLEALGFADPAGALRHVQALTAGVSRRAAIQRALLPAMLAAFAGAADPDAGLLAYRQVSDALEETPWYLRLLRDEGQVAQRLASLLGSSRYVADLLGRAPEALKLLAADEELVPRSREALVASFGAVVGRRDDWEDAVAAARGLRRHELLRIASADLLGRLDVAQVGTALTDVSAATLSAALQAAHHKIAAERRETVPARLAVIGMGRLGGGEQSYSSDADVLFVFEAEPGADEREATTVAHALAEETRRLLAIPAPDPPLPVDAGLRPEGRQGPLVRSLAAYAEYYRRWSAPWEAQALLRACPVAGDEHLGRRFVELVDPVRYPESFPAAGLVEIRRIKARIDAERLPRNADPATHTKLGRGGMADVEWTVQLLQLRHAYEVPALRTTGTLPALAAAHDAGLLTLADAEALGAAWRLAVHARNAVMLVRGRPSDSLPRSGREVVGVARALGWPAGLAPGEFLDDYRRVTRRARAVVERIFYG